MRRDVQINFHPRKCTTGSQLPSEFLASNDLTTTQAIKAIKFYREILQITYSVFAESRERK